MARKLSQAQSTLPLYHVSMDAQVDEALAKNGASVNDLIVAAVQQALVSHPELNQTFDGERTAVEGQPVGVASDRCQRGALTLEQLASRSRELISRARGGQMTAADQVLKNLDVDGVYRHGDATASHGAVRRRGLFNEWPSLRSPWGQIIAW